MSNINMKEFVEKNGATSLEEAKLKSFDFWNTQPVPKLTEVIGSDGQIMDINPENFNCTMNNKFIFDTLNKDNLEQVKLVFDFLNSYYVNNIDTKFKLHYSLEHINWYINSPNVISDLLIIIKLKSNNQIMGCIFGFPEQMQINKNRVNVVTAKLLCVYPKLRNKKMSCMLIKELTRRSALLGCKVGHYISGRYQPKPFNTSALYFRPINIKKILASKFMVFDDKESGISKQSAEKEMIDIEKYYSIPDNLDNNSGNFILMKDCHLVDACNLLNNYLDKYNFHKIFSQEEFNHIFYNNNIVLSYVLCNDEGSVVDFISFYKQNSKVISSDNYINAAYIFYYTSNEETIYQLIKNILVIIKKCGIDVLGLYNVMENEAIIDGLLFTQATNINYYLWNWKCKELVPSQIGTVPV